MGLFDIFSIGKIKKENEELKKQNSNLQKKIDDLGVNDYYQIKDKIDKLNTELEQKISDTESTIKVKQDESNRTIAENNKIIAKLREEIVTLTEQENKLSKQVKTHIRKIDRSKELYNSIAYSIDNFFISDAEYSNCKLSDRDYTDLELISPSVLLKLHCMDVKSLRKAFRENQKQIEKLLDQYSSRYTTKANKSIYNLMVIALQAELQNILYNLKYEKLDHSIELVKVVTAKYLKIAGEGNQSIAGTLTKFIGEIEYLFINAVKIEYNYYVKKEQARQEQLALKEQMRQEAEERKALEAERKKIEKEESKYHSEIDKLKEQLATAQETELEKLNARILELQSQLADVIVKKEEISNLANGKAGNVYIISNLGSFGENIFKVGMTRRLNPQDRVNELGDASVPFKFDVHSFIFSEDAVGLEGKLHSLLNEKRVNKVNLRKEFFYTSVDELETLVNKIEPTAEFNKTMLAEEFRQSQSSTENYTDSFIIDDAEDFE
ncbi:GIY-YIG nuclease family protein [Parablautia sp. Marseille-Q6255]|uniref:GIY-YIG nuclease family protein n=1 Tax=Parablautia sp. Marseille-Q6255 TaxID=3039593 RepID=UPI0024BCEDEE|nr:GIY-YIG nuclease family protein [Parablautia sp. Marseille-Q6255]